MNSRKVTTHRQEEESSAGRRQSETEGNAALQAREGMEEGKKSPLHYKATRGKVRFAPGSEAKPKEPTQDQDCRTRADS